MRMRRFRERLRYSIIGNLLVTLGLIACAYPGYVVFFFIVEHASVFKGFFWLILLLFFCALYGIYFLVNAYKSKRDQRAVYGLGDEKKRAPAAAHDAILTMADRPDEKALRRMERKREKEERRMGRERARAERREEKRKAKW